MNSRDLDTVLDVFTAMQKSALLLQRFYKKCGAYYIDHGAFFFDLSCQVDGFVRAVEEMRMIVFDHPEKFTVRESLSKVSLAVGKLVSELQYKETEIKRKSIPDRDVLHFARTMEALVHEADFPGLLATSHEPYALIIKEIPRLSDMRRDLLVARLSAV